MGHGGEPGMSLEATVRNVFLPSCNKGAMTRKESRATYHRAGFGGGWTVGSF